MVKKHVYFGFLLLATIAGCYKVPEPAPQPDPGRVYVTYKPIAPNDGCDCTNSQAAYLYSTYPGPRRANISIDTKDTFNNVQLGLITTQVDIAGAAEGGQDGVYVGCTIHAPSTSCRFQASYAANGSLQTREIPVELTSVYGSDSAPSLASCVAWCSDPDHPNAGACLNRGVRDFKVVAPMREAVLAAQSGQGNGVIPISEMLKRYGLKDSDNNCSRGDTIVKDGKITNQGQSLPNGEICVVRGNDLPSQVLSTLGLQSLTSGTGMAAKIPPKIEADTIQDLKSLNSNHGVAFLEPKNSPDIFFEGTGSDQLNRNFGGKVLASAKISAPGRRAQTLVATENGCIAVDEP
jgi:hypothetical protein